MNSDEGIDMLHTYIQYMYTMRSLFQLYCIFKITLRIFILIIILIDIPYLCLLAVASPICKKVFQHKALVAP